MAGPRQGASPVARIESFIIRIMEIALVLLMAGMVLMVFVNVVLRYGFNTGISFSEEMSRFLFVWLVFTGAVLTFREHGHIGVEALVKRFARKGRLIFMLVTNIIIVVCMAVLFYGTWLQHGINASITAPISGISMGWVNGIAYVTAIGIGFIAVVRIGRILAGSMTDAEVNHFAGEYDEAEMAARST